ncbi:MAG TPA: glycosyltransferase family 2 protein [Dehalococcoidia bacterium]|nr:glycosyltransferase family 2 protein [Dehalococcoidia bacterium]
MLSSVSAFFPCYNDRDSIPDLVAKVEKALQQVTNDYEIIVVDDGSRDGSVDVLRALAAQSKHLRLVLHEKNLGYGAALASGFRAATKDFVFYTDGDGQYDPSEMTVLAALMRPGVDVVNGYKRSRQDPWYRLLVGSLYQRAARVLFALPIRDVDCDFRLLRREAMRDVELESSDGAVCVELIRKLRDSGARMVEIPVSHYARAFGTSQFFKPVRILRAIRGFVRWYFKLVILQQQKRRVRHLTRQRMAVADAAVSPQADG